MRTRSLFRVVPWLVLLAMSLPVAAQSAARSQERAAASAAAAPACLVLEQGWIRMPPAPRPMLAGFGRIANHCGQPQVVVAARSPRFGEVSLHQTRVVDGVSRMRELERENRELRRSNEILKSAAAFFGAELDRRQRK